MLNEFLSRGTVQQNLNCFKTQFSQTVTHHNENQLLTHRSNIMKTKIYTILIACLIFGNCIFAQKGDLILSFDAIDQGTNAPVPLDRVFVENISQNCDTTVYGAEPYLSLFWPSAINEYELFLKDGFMLKQNIPNPFIERTEFNLLISENKDVVIELYDIYGQLVSGIDKTLPKGEHTFEINTSRPGVYLLSVKANYISKDIKLNSQSEGSGKNSINYLTSKNLPGFKNETVDGNFTFKPGDQLAMKASAEGYLDDTLYDNPSGNTSYTFEMTSGIIYTHNVFGTIINQGDDPISGVIVVILNPDGTESDLATTSNSDGDYQIPDVPQGQHTVRFKRDDYDSYEIEIVISDSNYQLDVVLEERGLPCPGIEQVEYEGRIYNTVQIGYQCWLKENLNVGIMIPGSTEMENNGIIEKYCYEDDTLNCNMYGGLYQWEETFGICPPGWRVPSDYDWKQLEGFVDSQYNSWDYEWEQEGPRGSDVGAMLKSQNGWWNNNNGYDRYGFTALPVGVRPLNGSFYYLGGVACFWTSETAPYLDAYYRQLDSNHSQSERNQAPAGFGISVRCLKN